jgi:probable F420-dependent oxidoreductase
MDLGRLGVWSGRFWGDRQAAREEAAVLDDMGYRTLWFPNGPEAFALARDLLDATRHIVVATGIVSIWTHPADEATRAHHELTQAYPGRFMLGLGVSHAHLVNRTEAGRYARPVQTMVEYLAALDAAPNSVPKDERILAALGPHMLAIARERSAGAHPYLVTPEHTRQARETLGAGPLLAPEQAVLVERDPARAREIARVYLSRYLQAPNYVNNWRRLGFMDDEFTNGGSDRLVDAMVAWGNVETIRERIAQHYAAGADHVCIQALPTDPAQAPIEQWRALAP